MSNKRNRRRDGQRVRSEIDRKPKHVTKAMEVFVASLPAERERKAEERRRKRPTNEEKQEREKRIRRWRLGTRGAAPPRKPRKQRKKYGNTYYTHSLDN
jgi:hypothetical protein